MKDKPGFLDSIKSKPKTSKAYDVYFVGQKLAHILSSTCDSEAEAKKACEIGVELWKLAEGKDGESG